MNLHHHAAVRAGRATFDPSEMQRGEKLLLAAPLQVLVRPNEAKESSATSGSGPFFDVVSLIDDVGSRGVKRTRGRQRRNDAIDPNRASSGARLFVET